MQSVNHPLTPIEVVRRFSQLRVLVIGDAMLDTYLEGTATRICTEGPVPVVRKTVTQRFPGGAANTAANLHALNADVMFLAVIGHDEEGSLLRTVLKENGVSDRWCVEDEQAHTLHKLRIIADGQYVVRFDEGGELEDGYSLQTRQQLLAHVDALYAQCDLVVVSDYVYGAVFDALIERLRVLHAADPKVLLIDSKALQRFRTLEATIVTPNYQEARLCVEHMSGSHPSSAASDLAAVADVARQLLASLQTEWVAVTLAAQGVWLQNREQRSMHVPAYQFEKAHDVGAGDSFSSALALALAAGADYEEAARIAIDAASIAVVKTRTSLVLHQELLQRVSVRFYTTETSRLSATAADRKERLLLLQAQLDAERLQGRRIVFTNGFFNMLHAGHIQFLRQAKELGDILVVGVNSDASVRRLKGLAQFVNNESDRCALVTALGMVDYVIVFDEDTPEDIIRALRPAVHVKGGDYADKYLPEAEAVREVGGQLVILPLAGALDTLDAFKLVASLKVAEMGNGTYDVDEQSVLF